MLRNWRYGTVTCQGQGARQDIDSLKTQQRLSASWAAGKPDRAVTSEARQLLGKGNRQMNGHFGPKYACFPEHPIFDRMRLARNRRRDPGALREKPG